jgi:alpha-L-fucosidase
MRQLTMSVSGVLLLLSAISAQTLTLDSLQRRFVDQRFGMFIHYNFNTYYSGWAEARQNPLLFNPTNLDCGQWARAAKAAKMTYGVLTCKHHDGFAIWPTKTVPPNGETPYTIQQSSVPNMDVVKAYVDSFRAYGLGPGLYFSIWDPNNGVPYPITTTWTPTERSYVLAQITELLTNYGEIPIFWFDGYSWAMGHKGVPWQQIYDTIKALQPNCLVVETTGMIEPWESDLCFIEESIPHLWIPPTNTSAAVQACPIGGNWFWDATVTSGASMLSVTDIVNTHLVALNKAYTTFQLDCPPNKAGMMDTALVNRLTAVGAAWSPDLTRAPLPTQPQLIQQPITPVSATATSGTAYNAIDGFNDRAAVATHQTLWQSTGTLPQSITLDLGQVYNNITMLTCLPRRDTTAAGPVLTGNVLKYKIYVSTDSTNFTQVTSGTGTGGTFGVWPASRWLQRAYFPSQTAKFVKFEVDSAYGGTTAIIGELAVGGGTPMAPTLVAPANGATGQTLASVSWGSADVAVSYGLQVSISSSFATTVYSQTGLTALSQPVSGVVPNTTYYWRVNAKGGVSYLGPSLWSSVWSFTTGTTVSVLSQQSFRAKSAELSVANEMLSYTVPEGRAVISFQDILGRTTVVVNRVQSAGHYSMGLRGYHFASGCYIVRLRTGGIEKVASVMLTR